MMHLFPSLPNLTRISNTIGSGPRRHEGCADFFVSLYHHGGLVCVIELTGGVSALACFGKFPYPICKLDDFFFRSSELRVGFIWLVCIATGLVPFLLFFAPFGACLVFGSGWDEQICLGLVWRRTTGGLCCSRGGNVSGIQG